MTTETVTPYDSSLANEAALLASLDRHYTRLISKTFQNNEPGTGRSTSGQHAAVSQLLAVKSAVVTRIKQLTGNVP